MIVRVFDNGPGDLGSIPGRVIPKTQKWYLMPPSLTLSIIRYGSRVKWRNPGKWVASFLTPWCSNYRKGSFWVTLDYGRQLYLYRLSSFYILVLGTCFGLYVFFRRFRMTKLSSGCSFYCKDYFDWLLWFCLIKLSSLNQSKGGARGVMVIVVGNGHSDTSSNPGRDWLHFT